MGTVTAVTCAEGMTDRYKVEVGIRQGSTLGPFSFAVIMDSRLRGL